MHSTDYLAGSFEFETELTTLPDGKHKASALGFSATHEDQSQALNNLNYIINEKMEQGLLVPNGG